jgi:hypothetical protein
MALSKIDVANMLTGVTPVANGGTARTVMTGTPIQIVNSAAVGGNTASSSTSFAASGYSLAITPAQASSKIFLSFNGNGGTATDNVSLKCKIYRDIASGGFSALTNSDTQHVYQNAGGTVTAHTNFQFLDSPSYTVGNAITYKIYIAISATGTVNLYQETSSRNNLTLMEISA